MDKPEEDWNGLHLGKFENRRPTFFQIYGMSVYTCNKISYTHQLLCGHDLADERLLTFRVHNKQKYLK